MKINDLVCGAMFLALFTGCHTEEKVEEVPFIQFADKLEAENLISGADDFSNHLNQFDLDVRLQKKEGTKGEWEELVKKETMAWTEEEMARIHMAFDSLHTNIDKMQLDIPFPDTIIMLKTSMKEELGAGAYTRKNWIAIGANELQKATDGQLTQLVAHELFHVLSRHNEAFKAKVYSTFGFENAGREIHFAEDAAEKRITNPDIAKRDSYIRLKVDGEVRNCVEFIYSDEDYQGGDIFDCLNVGFIPLDDQMQPVVAGDTTVIYPMSAVAEEFLSKIGKNTGYIIDPEEISAEHFSFLLTEKEGLPDPEYIEMMKKSLQKKK